MARPAPPDETSPARLIATMVGIVGILLLGSLAWSAVGALFSALGEAASSLSPRPGPTRFPTAVVGAVLTATATPRAQLTDTPVPVAGATPPQQATPSLQVTPPQQATPTRPATPAIATPTPAASSRAPWILLPVPAPGSHIPPGAVTIEARGRGDAPITAIRLDMDGTALPVSLEQRSESTWRGVAVVSVPAGQHAVRATVVDDQGRTGSYRWTFEAGP
jgi:hypothetical protein